MGALTEAGLARLEEGRAAFNRGEYFEAHELWEEAWRKLDGDERIIVQGLIQIAAGLHHLGHHRPRPAAGLLRKGLDKVSRGAFSAPGDLRLGELASDVARLLVALQATGANAPHPRPPRL